MKKVTTTILTLSFVILALNSFAQKSYKIYNITLKAKQIGGLKEFGSGKSGYKQLLSEQPIIKDPHNYTEVIGGYTDDIYSFTPRDLFNMSTFNNKYPFLDEIDIDYYKSKGFDKIKKTNPQLSNDNLFIQFEKDFNNAITDSEKKDVVLNDKYSKFRWSLIDSRLEFLPADSFELKKSEQTKYTAKLKADLSAKIAEYNLDASAKITAYISGLVDKSMNVKGCFTSVSFDDSYVSFITNHITDLKKEDLTKDMFVKNLNKYIDSEDARLITEVGVLILEAKYDKTVLNETKIAADLQGKFDIPQVQALNIAVSIVATVDIKKSINFNSNFHKAFIISLLTDKSLDNLDYGKVQNAVMLLK